MTRTELFNRLNDVALEATTIFRCARDLLLYDPLAPEPIEYKEISFIYEAICAYIDFIKEYFNMHETGCERAPQYIEEYVQEVIVGELDGLRDVFDNRIPTYFKKTV